MLKFNEICMGNIYLNHTNFKKTHVKSCMHLQIHFQVSMEKRQIETTRVVVWLPYGHNHAFYLFTCFA